MFSPIPKAERSKNRVYSRSLAGIAGLYPTGDMDISFECCVWPGRGVCYWPILRLEESYRPWCVIVWDLETLRMRRPWPALGCCTRERRKEREREREREMFSTPISYPPLTLFLYQTKICMCFGAVAYYLIFKPFNQLLFFFKTKIPTLSSRVLYIQFQPLKTELSLSHSLSLSLKVHGHEFRVLLHHRKL